MQNGKLAYFLQICSVSTLPFYNYSNNTNVCRRRPVRPSPGYRVPHTYCIPALVSLRHRRSSICFCSALSVFCCFISCFFNIRQRSTRTRAAVSLFFRGFGVFSYCVVFAFGILLASVFCVGKCVALLKAYFLNFKGLINPTRSYRQIRVAYRGAFALQSYLSTI